MSAIDLTLPRLQTEEGFRPNAYRDEVGKLTIGYGFNVDAGISRTAAAALLAAQVTEIVANLGQYAWYSGLDDPRRSVLIDLAFNAGIGGLLHFPRMLAAIGVKDWQTAHDELLNSDAARMLPSRYGPLADILLTGVSA